MRELSIFSEDSGQRVFLETFNLLLMFDIVFVFFSISRVCHLFGVLFATFAARNKKLFATWLQIYS